MYVSTTVPLQWAKYLIIAPVVQYREADAPTSDLETPPWPLWPHWDPYSEGGTPYYSIIPFLSQNPNKLLKEAEADGSDENRKQDIFKALVRHRGPFTR
jgi:hypothetical protein